MNQIEVERLVRRGAASLAEGLHFYWPSTGNNEIPERNISVHLAKVLLDAGFFVFAEAHTEGSVDVHLDLLALHPSEGTLVAAEFKRLYSAEKAREMGRDVDRIRSFRPQEKPELKHPGLVVTSRYGLIAATTWDERLASWFLSDDSAEDPTGGALDQLWKSLPRPLTRWGAIPLSSVKKEERQHTHWLVYALFPA